MGRDRERWEGIGREGLDREWWGGTGGGREEQRAVGRDSERWEG